MKLLEYKAHEIFKKYDLPCRNGNVVGSMEELTKLRGKIKYPVVMGRKDRRSCAGRNPPLPVTGSKR